MFVFDEQKKSRETENTQTALSSFMLSSLFFCLRGLCCFYLNVLVLRHNRFSYFLSERIIWRMNMLGMYMYPCRRICLCFARPCHVGTVAIKHWWQNKTFRITYH